MGTGVAAEQTAVSRATLTTGMRGGLGRTLLTTFLILAILPLALVGWYAVRQNSLNLQNEVTHKLAVIATLKAQELQVWMADREAILFSGAGEEAIASPPVWDTLRQRDPDLVGVMLQDAAGRSLWSLGVCEAAGVPSETQLTLAFPHGEESLLLCYPLSVLEQIVQADVPLGEAGHIYLTQQGIICSEGGMVDEPAPVFSATGIGTYLNHEGVLVVGVYRPLLAAELGVLVEQEQAALMVSSDRMAATLIGGILALALVTTIIASLVVRQVTRPVVRLTGAALEMAEGQLDQHVPVTSRDEIGILTYVFNKMADELKSLYADLEAKVVERTQRLQRANYQIQQRALQLAASLEVSQAVTSIRAPTALLERVADLMRDRFLYASVAVYLVGSSTEQVCLQAVSPLNADWPPSVRKDDGTVMGDTLSKVEIQVRRWEVGQDSEWYRRTFSRVAIPLKMRERVLGVLAVLSTEREGISDDSFKVLEHVANQITIALENARAYEKEKETAQRLRETEEFRSNFLAHMSHGLREPLTNIIGFSSLLLKGFDGAINTQQQGDLQIIYANSQHLLGLINDLLDVSQIEAGLMELQFQELNLAEIIKSVMATLSALVRDKDIELHREIALDLPLVWADAARTRQVLLRLLTNAARFTGQGNITVSASANEREVQVSVSDTGVGMTPEEQAHIFERFERGHLGSSARPGSNGLGLALSKEFVELHGGHIWVESQVGQGSTFTFTLPLQAGLAAAETGQEERMAET
ncbi:MAG: ATP-binding protein [Chloroflexota bacterium]|nr:ATP-binding protein [Chloroflexota bacterium]